MEKQRCKKTSPENVIPKISQENYNRRNYCVFDHSSYCWRFREQWMTAIPSLSKRTSMKTAIYYSKFKLEVNIFRVKGMKWDIAVSYKYFTGIRTFDIEKCSFLPVISKFMWSVWNENRLKYGNCHLKISKSSTFLACHSAGKFEDEIFGSWWTVNQHSVEKIPLVRRLLAPKSKRRGLSRPTSSNAT